MKISKSSGCIFKYRSDKLTVDENNIIRMDSTLRPKTSQGVEPSVGFLFNTIAVKSPVIDLW